MTYVINEEICEKKGMNLPSLLAVMLIKTGVNISELFNDLLKKEIIIRDMFSENFIVTQNWDNICCNILLSGDKEVPKEDELETLANELREMFPSGKKEGTNTYWRGNTKDVKNKLQKFFKLYGNTYSFEQIKEGTRKYIDSYNGDYQFMRALQYFIIKDNSSDLATYLENMNQDDEQNQNWNVELK